jgi:4a-hydroxytetrahydrobiopterin dehydratase
LNFFKRKPLYKEIILIMWTEKDNQLSATFHFKDFSQAFAFMTEVAMLAEKHEHHPLWTNVWNRVEINLSTHDAGDVVTDKDRDLAKAIDRVLTRYQ